MIPGLSPPKQDAAVTDEDLRAILDGHAWIKVRRYEAPADATVEERLRLLEQHHLRETEFLIASCRQLARELLAARRPEEAPELGSRLT